MAQDKSTQGPAGLSNPGLSVTQPNGGGSLGEQYAANPSSAFPASDKSSQGSAGVTNKMVHTVEETRNFGAGN